MILFARARSVSESHRRIRPQQVILMVARQERHHSEETEQPVEHSTRSSGPAHDSVDLRSPDDSDTIKKRMQLPANEESHTLTQGFEVGPQPGQSPQPASDSQTSQPTHTRLVSPLLTGLLRASNDDSVSVVLSPAPGKRVEPESTGSKGERAVLSAAERLSLGVNNADPAYPVEAPGKPVEGAAGLVDAGAQHISLTSTKADDAPGSIGSRVAPADKSLDSPGNSVAVGWARTTDTAYNVADTSSRAIVRSKELLSDSSVGSDKAGVVNSATAAGDKGWKPDFGVSTGDKGWKPDYGVTADDKGWKPDYTAVARDSGTGSKGETSSTSYTGWKLDPSPANATSWKVVDAGQTKDVGWLNVADAKPGAYNKVVDNLGSWALNEILQKVDKYFKVDTGNVGSKPVESAIGSNVEKRGWVEKPGADKPGADKGLVPLPGNGPKEKRDDFQKLDSLDVRKPQAFKVDKLDREESTATVKPQPGKVEPIRSKDEAPSKLNLSTKLDLPVKLDLPKKLDLPTKLDWQTKPDLLAKLDLRGKENFVVGQKDLAVESKVDKSLPALKERLPLVSSTKELVQDRPQQIREFQQKLDQLVFIGKPSAESDRRGPQERVDRAVLFIPPHEVRIQARLELLDQTRRTLGESKVENGSRRNEPHEFRVIDRTLKGAGENPQIKREDLPLGRPREGKVEQPGEPRPNGKIEMQLGKKEIDGAKKDAEVGKKSVESKRETVKTEGTETGVKIQIITPKGPGAIAEEDTAKKKGKKLFGEDDEDANLQPPPEETKKKPDDDTPQVVLTQPLSPLENTQEETSSQAQVCEDELDAEERRQRNLAILAASSPNANDPNQSQQSQTNTQASGNGGSSPQIDPSTVLPTIELTDQASTVLPVPVESTVDAISEIEQRYDIEMDAYAAHAATIQAMRERELLGYEMREQEQRQERERLAEERNARRQRELEENDRRMALLAQKRKSAQVASDKIANARVTYVIQPGDTLESIARRMLSDKRLSGLVFDLNRSAIPWRIESGRRYLALKPGLTIQLPNHVDITRYKASKRTTTLPFGYDVMPGTTTPATTHTLPSEQAARQKTRRDNVEKILGPLSSSVDEPAYCIARLGETLNSLARRHPHLQDESLWFLLAEVNNLSQETDAIGRAKARLTRGMKLRLPSSQQILEFRSKQCTPAKTADADATQTTIAETRRDVVCEHVFLDQNIRLLIARDRISMNEVQYSLQIFVADWQCVRSYEESHSGNWIRHQYDRYGAVRSFALDLPLPVIKELAHNDLYGAWEGYVSEYLAISSTKTA